MRCFAPGKLACVVSVLQVARAVDGIAHTQSNSFAASVADSNAAVTDFQLTVDVSNAWRNVSSNLYAAFIEDINHSVTGGLLAELLNDVQCNGPFVGQGDVPGTTRVSLMSNWTALDQGPFYLRFVGGYVLTRDGSGDATFSMMSPGLTGEPGSMSFITIYGPNTDCVGGYYLAANNMSSSGQLMQAKLDGSKSTNESATFLMSPGVNGSGVVLTSRSPAFPGWLLTVGNYKTGGWVGDQYTVSLVDPASVSPSPGPAQQWYIAPPKQPAQEAWQLTHGVGSTVSGSFDDSMPPLNPNSTTALKLTFNTSTGMNTTLPGVCNVGYLGGFGVSPGDVFNLSFWMLTYDVPNGTCTDASLNATLDGPVPGWMTPSIEAVDGSAEFTTFQFIPVALAPGVWTRYSATLIAQKAPQPNSTANFCLRSAVNGTVWLDAPSLTPAVTFMNRTNGMRNDLATMVADMRPAALRFPGGCFVEGINHTTAWNFSTTVGPIETRPGHFNMWQYWSNDRAGMYEYLQWAEDMNAMPIWVLNAGLFYGGGSDPVQPWVDHALASMEFAMGDPDTYWGNQRSLMGHTAPFQIEYVAIGNENSGEDYVAHYQAIYDALKGVYPWVKYIANTNISSASTHIDLFDYHTYPSVDWFFEHQWDWDTVQQRGDDDPKVFNSEYASKQQAARGNLYGALGEAAWAIGLERNSDLVLLASYAPLLAHVSDTDWLPDAIMFNDTSTYGTPSYYVQKLFGSNNSPQSTLLAFSLTASKAAAAPKPQPFQRGTPLFNNGANFSITVSLDSSNEAAPAIVIKMVNYASATRTLSLDLTQLQSGWSQPASGLLSTIASPTSDLQDTNDFDHPYRVAIIDTQVDTAAGSVLTLPANSIHVLRLDLTSR